MHITDYYLVLQVGYLGIKFADLSREAIQMYNMPSGAFVMYVAPGEAADNAGIQKSDIITRLDGQKVSSKADINDKLQYYSAGEQIEIEVSENAIKIVLPIFETNVNLTEDEKVIYKFLSKTMLKPISEIAPYVPFGKSKTTQLLKAMEKKGVIAVEGKGRGTKYIIK